MQLLTPQNFFLGPVHLHPKTDNWDYLRSPIMKKKIVSCFDIGEVPRSPGKWHWNRLSFLPFIFSFKQCGNRHIKVPKNAPELLFPVSGIKCSNKMLIL